MIKKNAVDLQHTFFQILVAMLMVFVLLICVASPAHAVVGVTSILIPSVIAALESWGISTAADGLDGDEIAQWFHDKLTDWSTYAGIALENIVTGIKMTPIGQVLLNPFALAGIREFGAWLVQQEGLVAGGSDVPVITGGTTLNGYQVWSECYLVSSLHGTIRLVPDEGSYIIVNPATGVQNYYFVYCIAPSSGFYLTEYKLTNGVYVQTHRFQVSTRIGSTSFYQNYSSYMNVSEISPGPVSYTVQTIAQGSGGVDTADGNLSLVPGDNMAVPTTSDIQDKEMLINTSLDVGADAAAWYEQVMNKVAANDMTATGTLVGAGTITADQVIDQGAIIEQEGVVSWPDVTVPIGVSGLDEIFPFCIPFDVYHFFQALAADPVAPSFEIPFVIPNIVDYTFELDLSDFDQVAQILRTVELLAFCVGLAFVTRSFFIRG